MKLKELIAQFFDKKMQDRFQIEAEKLKKQANENITGCTRRNITLDDKGWPTLSDAEADAQRAYKNQRNGKCKDFFIRSLTWDALQTLLGNKDTSLAISAKISG